MKTKVILVTVAVDWQENKFLTSSKSDKGWEPFYAPIAEENTIDNVLRQLFSRIVDLHIEWANFTPLGNEIINGELCLFYSTQIPVDSRWKGCILVDSGYVPEEHPFRKYLENAVRSVV